MSEFEVNCINKTNRDSQHEGITHIGNSNRSWRLTRAEAIKRIDSGKEQFYTVDAKSGSRAYIGVVREVGKDPYLRTYADKKFASSV